jgi:hypothetical protein
MPMPTQIQTFYAESLHYIKKEFVMLVLVLLL